MVLIPYNLFILTIDYSKNFTTRQLLTIDQMTMFVVKYIVIQINGQVYGSINYAPITNAHILEMSFTTVRVYFCPKFAPRVTSKVKAI